MNDKELIEKYLSGEEIFLEKLLKKHLQTIFSVCYRICLDENDANDICQNVVIKIIKNLKKFKFKSNFKTWYYKIAYNESISFLKSKKNNFCIDDFLNYDLEKEKIEDKINKKDLEEKITNEINKLPLIERNIILYYYFDEIKIKEISEIMQINENTVKTKLKRTKETLQTKFKKYEKFN